jgi:ornithine cyclodeaminase/alanine dehydrogenase-like protein (mu-crystallin family)
MKIYTRYEIEQAIDIPYLMKEIEIGLRLANQGKTLNAPVSFIHVDNLIQCSNYGDLSHAKNIDLKSVIELGELIEEPRKRNPEWITVADLTGVAIEDLQIAKTIYMKLESL